MAASGCPGDDAIAAFAEGGLGAEERAAIERHLDQCASCRRAIAALIAVGDEKSTARERPGAAAPPATATPAPTPTPEPGVPALGDRFGRYVALRVLGKGGMGIVIAAHDPELDRQVAIKLVHPKVWRRATEEARELL